MSAPFKSSVLASAGAVVGGKYVLVERIAEGGMGHLWRAVHRGLGREVALKLVDMEEPGAEERIARILREAEICAAVRHRYVVEIHDADTTPDGQPYIVMELLRGETLAQRMARPPSMRLDELVGILARCLAGLEAIHEAGVIHRDLKPENIVLSEHPQDGIVPKIVDFGISCRGFPISSREKRLTRQGTVLGTPWYMPPEQACGYDLGPEADVYAMGVIAYEALTGRLPFDSDSLAPLLLKITTETAPPLSYFRPDLPAALSAAVAKAMAPAREDRFGTALELRDALLQAIEGADLSYAALVPSESVMVLPDDPDPERPLDVFIERCERARQRPRSRRRLGQRSLAVGAWLVLTCAAGALLAGGDDAIEAPPARATSREGLESDVAILDVAAPTPSRAEPTFVREEVAREAPDESAAVEARGDSAKPRIERTRAAVPAAFRRLDF